MNCAVCGLESGQYILCPNCYGKLKEGTIIKCSKCGRYHYATLGTCPQVVKEQPENLYVMRPSLMSDIEQVYYKILTQILSGDYYVFPQINLVAFIEKTDGSKYRNELFRNVDFLVTNKYYKPVMAIEINDKTHLQQDRIDRDNKVKSILSDAKIPLVTFWVKDGQSSLYIANVLEGVLKGCTHHEVKQTKNSKTTPTHHKPPVMQYNQTPPQRREGCYIATCVYGSYDCQEVVTLRRFRDTQLTKSILGRGFIKLYYATSPTLVKLFGNTKLFKSVWKFILDRIVEKLS